MNKGKSPLLKKKLSKTLNKSADIITLKKAQKKLVVDEVGARQKIKEAAIRLFAVNGLDGTSTRDIAKESKLNLSLISYYFGGKEGLYLTVIREFALHVKEQIESLIGNFEKIQMDQESLRDMICSLVDLLFELREKHPNMGLIMTREKVSGMVHTQEIHDQIFIHVGEKIKTSIVRAQKYGIVNKKINPDFFIFCLLESIVGYFCMHDSPVTGPELGRKCYKLPLQKEEFKNQIAHICLEGILK